MGLVASDRFKELTGRFQRALAENPEWSKHVRSAPPGKPLTYDSRSGLSKEEFDEYLELSKSLTAGKAGEGTLTINSSRDQAYSLEGDESLSQLTGIEIDLRDNVVRTPLGVAKDCSIVNAAKSIIGPWAGTKWTLKKPSTESAEEMTIEFALGKQSDSGRGVMYYRVKEGGRGGSTNVMQMVTFDVPAKE
jgi:hypothetical protein